MVNAGNSGEYVAWDSKMKIVLDQYLRLRGKPVNSLRAVDQALKNKYGRACLDWKESKRNSVSPNGNPETKKSRMWWGSILVSFRKYFYNPSSLDLSRQSYKTTTMH